MLHEQSSGATFTSFSSSCNSLRRQLQKQLQKKQKIIDFNFFPMFDKKNIFSRVIYAYFKIESRLVLSMQLLRLSSANKQIKVKQSVTPQLNEKRKDGENQKQQILF